MREIYLRQPWNLGKSGAVRWGLEYRWPIREEHSSQVQKVVGEPQSTGALHMQSPVQMSAASLSPDPMTNLDSKGPGEFAVASIQQRFESFSYCRRGKLLTRDQRPSFVPSPLHVNLHCSRPLLWWTPSLDYGNLVQARASLLDLPLTHEPFLIERDLL